MGKKSCIWFFVLLSLPAFSFAQRKVSFLASDKLVVNADLYLQDASFPYIILLHKEESSRGEYKTIAPKLMRLGFNCLAVDLRSGKECNFVQNETAVTAKQEGLKTTLLDCEQDILAAIDYVGKTAINRKCILFGSSFSASLVLKIANHNKSVTSVIAFSPGEYFGQGTVKTWLTAFDKLTLVAVTKTEYPFVTELLKGIPVEKLTLFQPSSGGAHGALALYDNNPSANEYWMSLMMFVKKVKETNYK